MQGGTTSEALCLLSRGGQFPFSCICPASIVMNPHSVHTYGIPHSWECCKVPHPLPPSEKDFKNRPEPYLVPRVCFDLWELELCVVGVHFTDLLLGGRAQDLDDLHQLVHAAVSREDGLAEEQLRKHAAGTPDICTVSKN